jgi:hypothetical protein
MSLIGAIVLVAGTVMLSGCTPRALLDYLVPTCRKNDTNCEMREATHPADLSDTSHWSKPFPVLRPLSDSTPLPARSPR